MPRESRGWVGRRQQAQQVGDLTANVVVGTLSQRSRLLLHFGPTGTAAGEPPKLTTPQLLSFPSLRLALSSPMPQFGGRLSAARCG